MLGAGLCRVELGWNRRLAATGDGGEFSSFSEGLDSTRGGVRGGVLGGLVLMSSVYRWEVTGHGQRIKGSTDQRDQLALRIRVGGLHGWGVAG